ncbi:3-isopropylmalate dehydrogenase [Enterococcus sp. HSIEG1]|nr:3-isopropylmalate dehydrogenase [Enterococcus sp. HSIEG1]
MRRALDLYANIRPIKVTDAFLPFSPLKEQIVKGTDLVLVRELTSGIYFGEKSYRQQRLRI